MLDTFWLVKLYLVAWIFLLSGCHTMQFWKIIVFNLKTISAALHKNRTILIFVQCCTRFILIKNGLKFFETHNLLWISNLELWIVSYISYKLLQTSLKLTISSYAVLKKPLVPSITHKLSIRITWKASMLTCAIQKWKYGSLKTLFLSVMNQNLWKMMQAC